MYTEEVERGQRFKLALRMGFPIFLLTSVLFFSLLSRYVETIPDNFIIIVVGILAVSVYFQFYLIYKGYDEGITDNITHTFTQNYFRKLFEKREKKETLTLLLFTIDNIADINERLGYKNGDRVLYSVSKAISEFFAKKDIYKLDISHYKGGSFLVMLRGDEERNRVLFELLCAKLGNTVIDGFEIKSSGAIVDTTISNDFDKLVERLFELQNAKREGYKNYDEKIDLADLERSVVEALESKRFSVMGQRAVAKGCEYVDISIKLVAKDGRIIHQKRFLPIISRKNLRLRYEIFKIETVLERLDTLPPRCYTVQLPAETIRDEHFFVALQKMMQKKRKQDIVFIISEKEYYPNVVYFNAQIAKYRALGIKIMLDELGRNHTTQLYLKDLDADMVRFDGSFGKKIKDIRYRGVLKGLNVMAKELGLMTVIRLIEDEEAKALAESLDIDIISGNFFSKIVPLQELR